MSYKSKKNVTKMTVRKRKISIFSLTNKAIKQGRIQGFVCGARGMVPTGWVREECPLLVFNVKWCIFLLFEALINRRKLKIKIVMIRKKFLLDQILKVLLSNEHKKITLLSMTEVHPTFWDF